MHWAETTGSVSSGHARSDGAYDLVATHFGDSRDALLYLDRRGQVAGVNDEWLLLFGDDPVELVGRRWGDIQWSGCSEVFDLLRRVQGDLQARSASIYNQHRRGFHLKLDLFVTPVADGAGTVLGFLARLRPAAD